MTGAELLSQAQRLLAEVPDSTGFPATQSAAILARRAIEVGTVESARSHQLIRVTGRAPDIHVTTTLIGIHLSLNRADVCRVRWTWSELSEACHHRPNRHYVERPSLVMLVDEVRLWLSLLDRSSSEPPYAPHHRQ